MRPVNLTIIIRISHHRNSDISRMVRRLQVAGELGAKAQKWAEALWQDGRPVAEDVLPTGCFS